MRTQGKNQITVWADKDQETIVKNHLKSWEIHVTSNSYTIEYYKALALLQVCNPRDPFRLFHFLDVDILVRGFSKI